MIVGIGIDLVDFERLQNWTKDKYIERILSIEEIEFYNTITHESRKMSFLGGRFAAKEAIFKAISHGDGTTHFKDISILNDQHGKPFVKTHPFDEKLVFNLSISHTDKQAIAHVIIERY